MKTIAYTIKYMVMLTIILSFSHTSGQNTGYYEFLPNAAGDIDKVGFDIGYHSVFSQWDGNGDEKVSEAEFYKVLFTKLDKNGNNYLTAKEWKVAQNYLLPGGNETLKNNPANNRSTGLPGNEFKKQDLDEDKNLTFFEFEAAMKKTSLFSRYDTNSDGLLTRQELNAMVYRLMDIDKNGFIDQKEFNLLRALYID